MAEFLTTLDSLYLTSHLPEEINIRTTTNQVEVKVYMSGYTIFTSTFYPYETVACFRDLRSIVELAMKQYSLKLGMLMILAREPSLGYSSDAVVMDICVICSNLNTIENSESFLSSHFLTTKRSALIPRNGHVLLDYFFKANEQSNNYALIYYKTAADSETVLEYNAALASVQDTVDKIVSSDLDHGYFQNLVSNGAGVTNAVVLGAEYHIGNRRFDIFFTDETPLLDFEFRNAFNVLETAYIYGVQSDKTKIDRSEAVIGRRTMFYDETTEVKHEIETAPMPYEEALWLNQLLTSKSVVRYMDTDKTAQVLITDISSEVSNSDKEMVKLKFSWKFDDGTEYAEDQKSK